MISLGLASPDTAGRHPAQPLNRSALALIQGGLNLRKATAFSSGSTVSINRELIDQTPRLVVASPVIDPIGPVVAGISNGF